jgi:acyl-CoA synthetase (NDP forming)
VQLAGHLLPHALFGFQQAFRQTTVTRQLGLQRLVQLAQTLNARPSSSPVRLCASSESSKSTG